MIFYTLLAYASIVALGGIIGHYKANSLPSLIMGLLYSGALFALLPLVKKGSRLALKSASFIVFTLVCFFGYRFSLSYAVFPPGVMSLLSLGVLAALFRALYR
ncbi:MAG: hypothetical protein K0S07_826 [Chlamydiales bacterium]|jgi:uncharacterized membrane protein (UPF0136 family)|nr:hypothetical protein [Chlamydiales bacterium]